MVEGKLDFRKPDPVRRRRPEAGDHTTADPLALVPGSSLLRFRSTVHLSRAGEGGRGPGLGRGQEAGRVGRAAPAPRPAPSSGTTRRSWPAGSASPVHSVEAPFAGQAEVDALAKALAEQIAGSFAEFEGVARGDPKLRAGQAVSLGAGRRPVRRPLHADHHPPRLRPRRGLHDLVHRQRPPGAVAAGGPARPAAAAAGGAGAADAGPRGVVSAIVTDVRDPDDLCRVKVKFPCHVRQLRERLGPHGPGRRRRRPGRGEAPRGQRRGAGGLRAGRPAPALHRRRALQRRRHPRRWATASSTRQRAPSSGGGSSPAPGTASCSSTATVTAASPSSPATASCGSRSTSRTKTVKITGPGDVIVDAGGKVTVTARATHRAVGRLVDHRSRPSRA